MQRHGDDRTNDADMGTGVGLDDGDNDSVNDDPCRENESVRSSGLFGALHGLKSLGGFQRPSLEGPLRPRDVKRLFVFFNETQFNAFSAGAVIDDARSRSLRRRTRASCAATWRCGGSRGE